MKKASCGWQLATGDRKLAIGGRQLAA